MTDYEKDPPEILYRIPGQTEYSTLAKVLDILFERISKLENSLQQLKRL